MHALRAHHKYSDQDVLEWLPFERDIYVQMIMDDYEKEKARNNG